MNDDMAPLLGDIDVEAKTREKYSAWLLHGLEVVKELGGAQTPGPVPAPDWRPFAKDEAHRRSTPWRPRRVQGSVLAEARSAGWILTEDAPHAHGHGVLRGLTVAVKDVIDVAGLPTRNGTPGALWREPATSAPAWAALAKAGAQCVGKAATHEMAWGVTTPQVPHPHDRRHIAGGSSGGSAASVAAGSSQAALATDTGGSIRIPAALCGVVGFRPTTATIGMAGITELASSQDVVGPLAIDVATCVAMLEVLTDRPLATDPSRTAGMRVGVLARPGRLQPVVEDAYRSTLESFDSAGVTLVACDTPAPRNSTSVSLLTMLYESAHKYAAIVRADARGFGGEARALLTIGERLEEHALSIDLARRAIIAQTAQMFTNERLDAFVTPTTPCTAPLRGAETIDIAGRAEPVSAALTRFTAWASVTAMPAISLPLTDDHLPVAMQVIAPPHREDVCADLAMTIEQLTRRNAS